jgi:hypothetical protein
VTDLPTHAQLRLQRPRVSWREENAGFVLYDRQTDALYEGNHVGREILNLLDKGASADEICDVLDNHHDVARDVLRRDIEQFLHFLSEEHLLVRS